MNTRTDAVLQKLGEVGFRAKTVSIRRLPAAQEAVARLIRDGMVSERLHRNWHFYLDSNQMMPEARTIFIIAIPQPVAVAWFEWGRSSYPGELPSGTFVRADERRAADILGGVLAHAGRRIVKARLALKTLAVRSGLAKYGKNNITYVPGMGSYHRLVAFYSDCPCEVDSWQDIGLLLSCEHCSLCREKCPAGSITGERFLIHAEKCEEYGRCEREISWWVGDGGHRTLTGCMLCQDMCPANKLYSGRTVEGPLFSGPETAAITGGTPWRQLPAETQQKLDRLADDEAYPVLARNLRGLLEARIS